MRRTIPPIEDAEVIREIPEEKAFTPEVESAEEVEKWNHDRIRQVYQLSLLGATDEQIAGVMGIGKTTMDRWKKKKPEFMKAMTRGKLEADAKVAEALFRRATGFKVMEQKVTIYRGQAIVTEVEKEVLPDSWAAAKWLSLRQRAIWAEVQKTESTQTIVNINKLDFSGFTTQELMLLEKIGLKQLMEHVRNN